MSGSDESLPSEEQSPDPLGGGNEAPIDASPIGDDGLPSESTEPTGKGMDSESTDVVQGNDLRMESTDKLAEAEYREVTDELPPSAADQEADVIIPAPNDVQLTPDESGSSADEE